MRIQIITIGVPKGAYKELFDEYAKRLGRFADVAVLHIKEGKDAEAKMLTASEKTHRVLLDEKGKEYTTTELAAKLEKWAVGGQSHVSFLIGGPDGHTDVARAVVNETWSLSKLTLPHDLAMVATVEALYRAASVTAGHPYHRG